MTANRATERLGTRLPIVQGPFGGGLSSTRLVAAVAARGGLGSFGAYHLAPQGILDLAAELRRLDVGQFALNLWVSDHDAGGLELSRDEFERAWRRFAPAFEELGVPKPAPPQRFSQRFDEQVEALLEAAPPVFSFVFGVPSAHVLRRCRQRGIVTVGAATSIAEAEALEAAGIDVIVATGSEAGGHRPSFLARAEDSLMGSFALTQLVAARVSVPVIAAGGIVDARGVRAARALGADAVQVGTAFLACEESGATAEHRAALFGRGAERTVLTRAFSGRLARGLANRWTAEQGGLDPLPFPVQGWFAGQLRAAAHAAGRTDLVALWGSQAAPNLRHHRVDALIDELAVGLTDTPFPSGRSTPASDRHPTHQGVTP